MVSRSLRNSVVVLLLTFISLGVYALSSSQHTLEGGVPKTVVEHIGEVVAESVVEYRLNDPERYAIIGAMSGGGESVEHTRVVVVPHHLVAAEAISLGLRAFVRNEDPPSTVVVLSPDHYNACPSVFCTTESSFHSGFGTTSVNEKYVATLLSNKVVARNTELFVNEHGVYSVLPFVSHYYPEATMVPIVVSQKRQLSREEGEQLLSMLLKLMKDESVVLLVSSDFSHYLPLADADQQDEETQKCLSKMDGEAIRALDNPAQSDCPFCLWVANEIASSLSYTHVAFPWHSNSAVLLGDREVESTTSHFVVTYGM